MLVGKKPKNINTLMISEPNHIRFTRQHKGKFDSEKHSEGDEPFLTILAALKPLQSRLSPKESETD